MTVSHCLNFTLHARQNQSKPKPLHGQREAFMKLMKQIFVFTFIVMLSLILVSGDSPLLAQSGNAQKVKKTEKDKDKEKKEKKEKEKVLHYEVSVTATRTKKDTFETPNPVSVVTREKILEKAPNTVTDLLTGMPGVDVNGAGASQARPVIRGFRGQRILLLQDGIRMNNSRRQQDFGGITSMVDVAEVDRVEVVRGPASVLYGSDAIGGVVNMITRIPSYKPGSSSLHGAIGLRFSSADKQGKYHANFNGNAGKFGYMFGGSFRKAGDYDAAAGSFGDIDLDEEVRVNDTGVKDNNLNLMLSYNLSDQDQVSLKFENYHAQDAGFGFVEPSLYDPGSPRIQIHYPDQKVSKLTFKYTNHTVGFALADLVSFTAYNQSNERELGMNIFIPFGIPGLPSAGLVLDSENYSDVDTLGFRLELNKGFKNHVVTYGVDFFSDRSNNSDNSTQMVVGFGPPRPTVDTTPQVPNATYRSIGAFIQDDISLFTRTSLILGLRYQNVNAKTKDTIGLEGLPLTDSTDQTVVGAANLIYALTDQVRLVFSVGRGFRSPNLIERFYNGVTPEGSAFQERNTGLKAETSLNFDVGFKYRHKGVFLEATYFNNTIKDGIRITETDRTIKIGENQVLKIWKNDNIDKLRMQGFEATGKVIFNFGLSSQANFTYLKSTNVGDPETPYVDTYSSKINVNLRYDHPKKWFWVGYDLRINGRQKDVNLGVNPLGEIIPSFTLHTATIGINLFPNSKIPQQLALIIQNLSNILYAEFSNASFFRPAPKRHIVLTWNMRF